MKDRNPKDYQKAVRVSWFENGSRYHPAWWVRTVERGRKAGCYVILVKKRDPSAKYPSVAAFKYVERTVPPNHVKPDNWPSASVEERYGLEAGFGFSEEGIFVPRTMKGGK